MNTQNLYQDIFDEIIDILPSQLSNDFPNENVFVDNLYSSSSLFENYHLLK